jgi:ketosteroid isomerase-like protein
MPLALPKPIADFVAANARLDGDAMLRPFAEGAVFVDNDERHEGRDQIRKLLAEEVVAAEAVFTPDTMREEGGTIVVEGPAHGNFPGSPIRFTYRFLLRDETIEAVEVTL